MIDASWMWRAECRGTTVEMVPRDKTGSAVTKAKAICMRCEVRPECLSYAMEFYAQRKLQLEGIWGGLNVDERRRLKAGRSPVSCLTCRTLFVGADGVRKCDGCSRGEVMARVEAHSDALRELIGQGMTVVAAAAKLGVSKDQATIWAAEHLQMRAYRTGANGRDLAKCGTDSAYRRHRREHERAGVIFDPSDLTCACKDLQRTAGRAAPCGTKAAQARHRRDRAREGLDTDLSSLTCACRPMPVQRGDKPPCGTAAAKSWHQRALRAAGKSRSLYGLDCACAPKTKKKDGESGKGDQGMAA